MSDETFEERSERRKRERAEREVERALETLQEHGHPIMGYEAALIELADERDRLQQDLSQDHQAAELARLRQGIRDRDARDQFFELARVAKANPRALGLLWRLRSTRARPTNRTCKPFRPRWSGSGKRLTTASSKSRRPRQRGSQRPGMSSGRQRRPAARGSYFKMAPGKATEQPHELKPTIRQAPERPQATGGRRAAGPSVEITRGSAPAEGQARGRATVRRPDMLSVHDENLSADS